MDSIPSTVPPGPPPTWRRLLPLLGILLLVWILSQQDATAMGDAFSRVSLSTMALAVLWFGSNVFVKAYRWQRLVAAQGIQLPVRVAVAAFLAGQFYGQVTFGRLGEFYRMEALIERKISPGVALSSCMFDRVLDLGLVAGSGAILSAFLLGDVRTALLAAALLLGLLLAGLVLVRTLDQDRSQSGLRQTLETLLVRLQGVPLVGRLAGMFGQLVTGARPLLRPLPLAESSFWTALGWLGHFAALWELSDGLRLELSHTLLTAAASLTALSTLLPVTVSGLGARELIFAQLFAPADVNTEAAVVLALLHFAVMSGTAIGLGLVGLAWRSLQPPA